jgi:uncharacterized protein
MNISPQPLFTPAPGAPPNRGIEWIFVGENGLRAGWSILLAYGLFYFFRLVLGTIFFTAHLVNDQVDYSPGRMFVLELIPFLAMLGAGALLASIEQRRMLDFNLADTRPVLHATSGAIA